MSLAFQDTVYKFINSPPGQLAAGGVLLRTDPLEPIVSLFKSLIEAINRPVIVFVDDLDRCAGEYVVGLLEGIQTLLRSTPIVYVVAADRKWICTSFEKVYADFESAVGDTGRPLGFLFLDKLLQISTRVPEISARSKREYWDSLLRISNSQNPQQFDAQRKRVEQKQLDDVRNVHKPEDLQAIIDAVKNDPIRKRAARAAAARQITTPAAQRVTEHRLQRFRVMVEPNPRSMKRLVNAYGLHQAALFLEGRFVAPEILARWTIIELRWPLLADFLTIHPQAAQASDANAGQRAPIPKSIRKLLQQEVVQAVLREMSDIPVLDEAGIRTITRTGEELGDV